MAPALAWREMSLNKGVVGREYAMKATACSPCMGALTGAGVQPAPVSVVRLALAGIEVMGLNLSVDGRRAPPRMRGLKV